MSVVGKDEVVSVLSGCSAIETINVTQSGQSTMNDWQVLVECVPWFLKSDAVVQVSKPRHGYQIPASLYDSFPSLAKLLAQATVTPVAIDEDHYDLLAWDGDDGYRIGWLCAPPISICDDKIYRDHAFLLQSFGGIIERVNEPSGTWLLNHNDVLTAREASHDASFLNEYSWAFCEKELPIQPLEYYCIAREANGNTTLCHRVTGEVILFAPDHAFGFVKPLSGCPEYTLYTLSGVLTFRDWVNAVAAQWLSHVV